MSARMVDTIRRKVITMDERDMEYVEYLIAKEEQQVRAETARYVHYLEQKEEDEQEERRRAAARRWNRILVQLAESVEDIFEAMGDREDIFRAMDGEETEFEQFMRERYELTPIYGCIDDFREEEIIMIPIRNEHGTVLEEQAYRPSVWTDIDGNERY